MKDKKLKTSELLSFGFGALGKDMVYGVIATFAMIYLTDVTKLPAAFVGTMFFVAKFWDAINDFVMGMIIDNTHTKWGKFKPYLLLGTVLSGIVTIMFFTKLPFEGIALYVAVTVLYILWGMTYTIMDIPYWSMIPNLSSDPADRVKLSVVPRIFAAIGQTLIIGGMGIPIMNALGGGQMGYTRFALAIGVVFLISTFVTCTGTRNQNNLNEVADGKKDKTTFKDAWNAIVKNDQLLVAVAVILFYNIAYNFAQGSMLYFFKYVAGDEKLFSYYTFASGIASVCGLFLFPVLSTKLSKKKVFVLAGIFPAIGLGLLFAGSYIAPTSMIIAVVAGFVFLTGYGLETGAVTVFLADCVDYGEYKLGKRNESVTFSCQTLLVKFTSALTTMMTGWALTATGYVPNGVQSAGTMMGIRVVALVGPIVAAIISMIIYLRKMNLTLETMETIGQELASRKAERASEEAAADQEIPVGAFAMSAE